MSHREREHPHGAVERGNDWLDGALAGWLLYIAINVAYYSFTADTSGWGAVGYDMLTVACALGAIAPLLRFKKIGWFLGILALGMMVQRQGAELLNEPARWKSLAPFLLVNVLGIGYLWWIREEFWPREGAAAADPADADGSIAPAQATDAALFSQPAAPAERLADAPADAPAATPDAAPTQTAATASTQAAAPAAPPPAVTQALAALHHRIVAAGSACAVTPEAVRAEAGRFGVTPAVLRTEGLSLYHTFLHHFLSTGPLTAQEERELVCLERGLDLDDAGVFRLRAQAGVGGGFALTPAPLDSAPPAPSAQPARPAEPALSAEPAAPAPELAVRMDEGRPYAAPAPGRDDLVPSQAEDPGVYAGSDEISSPPHSFADEPAPHPSSAERFSEPAPASEPAFGAGPAFAAESTGALADYEEHELRALADWARIELPAGAMTRASLNRLRALHRASTEPLATVPAADPLDAGERAIAVRGVELYRQPSGVPAGAPPPAGGPVLDPRALVDGGLERDRDLSHFQRAGACRFVLTDRRLLLIAPSGQQSPLPLDRVGGALPYRNGLEVRPVRGNPVFLAFADGVDEVAMRLDRAVRDLRARPRG